MRLPNPPRDLPAEEAAQLRGAADSVALRLRYHDDAVHSKRVPGAPAGAGGLRRGRAGAGRGVGLAAHGRGRLQSRSDARRAVSPARLRADHRAHRQHDGRGGAPADPRGVDQERPPPAARRVVDLWRPWLEARIGKDFGELDRAILDQDAYARATRRLLQDLDIDLGEADDVGGQRGAAGRRGSREREPERGRGRHRRRPGFGRRLARRRRGRGRAGRRRGRRRRDDAAVRATTTRAGRAAPGRCRAAAPTTPRSTAPSARLRTRSSTPTSCATPTSCRGCAICSTSSSAHLQSVIARLANRLQRRLMAQADPRLGIRSRRGPARRRAAVARRRQPDPAAWPTSASARPSSATPS